MKIRQGFVSNSSSSSFVALGFSINQEDKPCREILIATGSTVEEIDAIIQKEKDRYAEGGWDWDDEENTREALWDKMYDMGKEENVRILYGSEDGVDEDDKVIALMLMETDDYDGILKVFNNKGLLLESRVAELCGLDSKHNAYQNYILSLLKQGSEVSDRIRTAVKAKIGNGCT